MDAVDCLVFSQTSDGSQPLTNPISKPNERLNSRLQPRPSRVKEETQRDEFGDLIQINKRSKSVKHDASDFSAHSNVKKEFVSAHELYRTDNIPFQHNPPSTYGNQNFSQRSNFSQDSDRMVSVY